MTDHADLTARSYVRLLPPNACCLCFDVFDVADLSVTPEGEPVDVCKRCAAQEAAQVLVAWRQAERERDAALADVAKLREALKVLSMHSYLDAQRIARAVLAVSEEATDV